MCDAIYSTNALGTKSWTNGVLLKTTEDFCTGEYMFQHTDSKNFTIIIAENVLGGGFKKSKIKVHQDVVGVFSPLLRRLVSNPYCRQGTVLRVPPQHTEATVFILYYMYNQTLALKKLKRFCDWECKNERLREATWAATILRAVRVAALLEVDSSHPFMRMLLLERDKLGSTKNIGDGVAGGPSTLRLAEAGAKRFKKLLGIFYSSNFDNPPAKDPSLAVKLQQEKKNSSSKTSRSHLFAHSVFSKVQILPKLRSSRKRLRSGKILK